MLIQFNENFIRWLCNEKNVSDIFRELRTFFSTYFCIPTNFIRFVVNQIQLNVIFTFAITCVRLYNVLVRVHVMYNVVCTCAGNIALKLLR